MSILNDLPAILKHEATSTSAWEQVKGAKELDDRKGDFGFAEELQVKTGHVSIAERVMTTFQLCLWKWSVMG